MNDVRYYINNTECTPLNSNLTIIFSESENFFQYDKSLSSDLFFTKADYDLIKASFESEFVFKVTKNFVTIFEAFFSKYDCEVDDYKRIIKVNKLSEVNLLNSVKEGWSKQFNILSIVENISARADFQSVIEFTQFAQETDPTGWQLVRAGSQSGEIWARERCLIKNAAGSWVPLLDSAEKRIAYVRGYSYTNPNLNSYLVNNNPGGYLFVGLVDGTLLYINPANLVQPIYELLADNGKTVESSLKFLNSFKTCALFVKSGLRSNILFNLKTSELFCVFT
jgi:hypothetical protein